MQKQLCFIFCLLQFYFSFISIVLALFFIITLTLPTIQNAIVFGKSGCHPTDKNTEKRASSVCGLALASRYPHHRLYPIIPTIDQSVSTIEIKLKQNSFNAVVNVFCLSFVSVSFHVCGQFYGIFMSRSL